MIISTAPPSMYLYLPKPDVSNQNYQHTYLNVYIYIYINIYVHRPQRDGYGQIRYIPLYIGSHLPKVFGASKFPSWSCTDIFLISNNASITQRRWKLFARWSSFVGRPALGLESQPGDVRFPTKTTSLWGKLQSKFAFASHDLCSFSLSMVLD